jgi:hypothetical protein
VARARDQSDTTLLHGAASLGRSASGADAGDDTGYRWLRNEAGSMLIDGGPVGPAHLPGHAHSDMLGVLLWLNERPVVTDTGTFDYESGERRTYARGVRGHNTVQVGECEPVPLGGRFLMGPRPSPTVRTAVGEEVGLFEGRYDATPFDGPAYTHHRAVYVGDRWWFVRDRVRGTDGEPVRGRLHLHPDVEPAVRDCGRVRLQLPNDEVAWVQPVGTESVTAGRGPYFPRFGVTVDRPLLELRAETDRTTGETFGFLLTTRDLSESAVSIDDDVSTPTAVQFGDRSQRLPALGLDPD